MADKSLWQFSGEIYQRDGVEEACLWLQDNAGIDVVLLLFCCWLGHERKMLEPGAIAALSQSAQQWSTGLIAPLRQARRWYRNQNLGEFEPSLYSRLKETELAVEKALTVWLESALTPGMIAQADGENAHRACARQNIHSYLSCSDIELDQQGRGKLEIILARC